MVVRIKGAPRQGVWFSSDVVVVDVDSVTGSTFLTDLTVTTTDPRQDDVVNSHLEQCIEAIATRGTVIGLTVLTDAAFSVLVDYGQGYDPDSVVLGGQAAQDIDAEITAAINAIAGLSTAAVATFRGFTGNALGTPA
ncbi:MAG: hypothetical protein ACTSPB_16570 [Candidatus Thorarchaeota archaeon]